MESSVKKILISEEEIRDKVQELAETITTDYQDRHLTIIGLSNGALIFTADLIRRIPLPIHLDSLMVSSYQGTRSTGTLKILSDLKLPVEGRDILIVDDILDTGLTLSGVKKEMLTRGATSVKTCVLLDKKVERDSTIEADYAGFTIGNEFVIGYGLDYNEKFRNLPYIGIIKEEAIDA